MTTGERLVRALAAREFEDAAEQLSAAFALKGLVPSGLRQADSREEAMEIFRRWFGDAEALESVETSDVIGRPHIAYRVRCDSPEEGPVVFEQHGYYEDGPDGIVWLHVTCSGTRPLS